MSKRVANCRGKTTAHFGRIRYGRWTAKKVGRTVEAEELTRRKDALATMIAAPFKRLQRHQAR